MEEIWKDIVIEKNGVVYDYTGLYQVSSEGRVRNVKTGRVLKPSNVRGYYNVTLQKNKEKNYVAIHRLVALMFIPNDDSKNKTQVNHINEDKHDNRVTNLNWMTPKENTNHATGNLRRSKNNSQSKKVVCVETGKIYDSAAEAQRKNNITGIRNCCSGVQKTAGGYHWQYYED